MNFLYIPLHILYNFGLSLIVILLINSVIFNFKLDIKLGESTADGKIFLKKEEECIAACCGAPMMMVDHHYHENLTKEKIDKILGDLDLRISKKIWFVLIPLMRKNHGLIRPTENMVVMRLGRKSSAVSFLQKRLSKKSKHLA